MLCCFFLGKIDKMFPKPRFGKRIFGDPAGSTKLDRPYCKRFWYSTYTMYTLHICFRINDVVLKTEGSQWWRRSAPSPGKAGVVPFFCLSWWRCFAKFPCCHVFCLCLACLCFRSSAPDGSSKIVADPAKIMTVSLATCVWDNARLFWMYHALSKRADSPWWPESQTAQILTGL